MKFEVFKDKNRVMVTEHEKLIPDKTRLKQIKAAGYLIKLDGKVIKI